MKLDCVDRMGCLEWSLRKATIVSIMPKSLGVVGTLVFFGRPPQVPGAFVVAEVLSGQFSQCTEHFGVIVLNTNGDHLFGSRVRLRRNDRRKHLTSADRGHHAGWKRGDCRTKIAVSRETVGRARGNV